MISDESGQYLVDIAKKTILHYLETGERLELPDDYPEELDEKLGVFVTLNENNDLRGCIGYAEPIEPAIVATIEVAIAAAFNDPRFPKVTEDEFEKLDFEVTVLTKPEIIYVAHPDQYIDEIEIGNNVIISYGVYFACHGPNQGHNRIVIKNSI